MDSQVQIPLESSSAKQLLAATELKLLNQKANLPGLVRLLGHLAVMIISGNLWLTVDNWLLKLPALVIYGFSLAAMFAPFHECCHRTAFVDARLNDLVAWLAGIFSFYNSSFYRRYHKWHHRYTRIPSKDPELEDPQVTNWQEYLVEISGWNWWLGKFATHYQVATGKFENMPYISEDAKDEVIRSTRLQLAVYGGAIALSVIFQQPWFITFWLLPLAIGQTILRFILLAEHTGCSKDNNPLTNTRTTLTWFPIKFLMWNMPFHAEHHLYPAIPFHALPQAHQGLKEHFAVVEEGYIKVNQNITKT